MTVCSILATAGNMSIILKGVCQKLKLKYQRYKHANIKFSLFKNVYPN